MEGGGTVHGCPRALFLKQIERVCNALNICFPVIMPHTVHYQSTKQACVGEGHILPCRHRKRSIRESQNLNISVLFSYLGTSPFLGCLRISGIELR